jgi:hypothetical protein
MTLLSSRRKTRLTFVLGVVGACLAAFASNASAATITVNNEGELAAAVASGSPGDEIVLNQFNYAPSATLTVNRNLTIRGPQSGPVRSAISGSGITTGNPSGVFNIFRVSTGVTLTLQNVTLTGVDGSASAIDVLGTLNLEHSTVSGALGAALTVRNGGTLNTLNSTLSDNGTFAAVIVGGGIANLRSTTVAANDSGGISNAIGSTITLQNTIIDTATGSACARAVQTSTNSLAKDSSCGAGTAVGNPLLDSSLTNNGGPTNTRKLLAGSPAINAGLTDCPAADQRYAPRSAAPCDIGAYELTTAPVVTPPTTPAPVEATGPTGAVVNYGAATAYDYENNVSVPATCTPASGSVFPVGNTLVTCTATSALGTGSATFTVSVVDTTAPVVTVPADMTVDSTTGSPVPVTFTATASDTVDPASPTVACAPASGSSFAIGMTTVTCQATDTAGNTGSASFTVTVNDTSGGSASDSTDVTAVRNITTRVTVTPTVAFGPISEGDVRSNHSPTPASVNVRTNATTGYLLSVSRTKFSAPPTWTGSDDIPLAVTVAAPSGATAAQAGALPIPTSGPDAGVGSRSTFTSAAGDEWSPVYTLGPVPFAPAGDTHSVVTYTAVVQ